MTGEQVALQANPEQLRKLLKDFNELPAKVKTGVRKQLRSTGDDIIAAQRSILDGPLPAGIEVTGTTHAFATNKKTGKTYLRKLNVYGEREVKRPGRSSGLRDAIKENLRTRVVTGITRQGIEIRTLNSAAPMSRGWNAAKFRHPVFGQKDRPWVYQGGQPYFFKPIFEGRAAMIQAAVGILNDAIDGN